jgi:hypothetical protein
LSYGLCCNIWKAVKSKEKKMEFCFKLGKTAREIYEMLLRVYRDGAVSRMTVYKWFESYHGGAESTEIEQHSGHMSTSTIEENVKNQRNGSSRQKIDDSINI